MAKTPLVRISFQITGTLNVLFRREGDVVIAFCPALDLSTYGTGMADAERMMEDVLKTFLKDLIENGTLKPALMELGWRVKGNTLTAPPSSKLSGVKKRFTRSRPVPLEPLLRDALAA